MKNYRVIVCSSIFYEVEVQADNETQVKEFFNNGDIDFIGGEEIDLESHIYDIKEEVTA
jgi:hypothetical protein